MTCPHCPHCAKAEAERLAPLTETVLRLIAERGPLTITMLSDHLRRDRRDLRTALDTLAAAGTLTTERGPLTITMLSDHLRRDRRDLRTALDTLAAAGTLTTERRQPGGPGRPSIYYHLAP